MTQDDLSRLDSMARSHRPMATEAVEETSQTCVLFGLDDTTSWLKDIQF